MKKTKQITQKETQRTPFPFPKKGQKITPLPPPDEEEHDCKNCDDVHCKAQQVMDHLTGIVELTEQIGPTQLYNISLTLGSVMANLEANMHHLTKIEKLCQQVYGDLHPKEMGRTIN